MASTYIKLDLKAFRERLAGGHYANATGARRGAGKSEMTDDEKKKAHKAIDDHFGGAAPSKAGGSTKRPTKAAKVSAKESPKTRAAGRSKRAVKTEPSRSSKTPAETAPTASLELADLHAGAQATRESLAGLAGATELDPGLDVKTAVKHGAKILQHSIDRIGELLGVTPDTNPSDDLPAHGSGVSPETDEEEEDE